ncbi:MAG: host attachment family protein [Pseudomonadota bacterium]
MLGQGGWALVADGEKALFLENIGDADLPDFRIKTVEEHPLPHSNADVATDRPGRYPDPAAGRSAVEQPDYKQLERARFAAEIAALLNTAVAKGDCRELAIFAPPSILGELRKELPEAVTARLIGAFDKDYASLPTDEMETRVVSALRGTV